ncbi:hypothetical protein F5B22DRAFT_207597 [Xylaria bambusicola]|uniref:uncharacterized protein n=1 Tax=Xylaria bambusicola TaxID=326684 RepID=UPI00200788AC|nr:uncharacterized protein F5B22DRAFT_207597 [Xylaria bambusicola]KAI0514897.1 hypothetical protein F5B22DRAFT_207597 [Xylaria bambusicola]
MDDPTLNDRGGEPPRWERKRPHQPHDANGRSVRRRIDERGSMRERRSRSPRRPDHSDHRGHTRVGDVSHRRHQRSDTRDDRYDAGHRDNARCHTSSRSARSRSPTRHHDSHHHRSHHAPNASHLNHDRELPCNARELSRSADFSTFRPLFARYLDVQKQIDLTTLDEREVRGRWKSFVSKWNNSELAEGWYRPETFEDAALEARGTSNIPETGKGRGGKHSSPARQEADLGRQDAKGEDEDDDDDGYGPILPTQDDLDNSTRGANSLSQNKHGPGIPTLSDIALRREHEASDRDDAHELLRHERKADRALQKERLDELVPRADAGTQARRLEKRREVRDANTSFANAKSSNDVPELADADLMGGDGGGLEEYKRLKREAERKKTEREVRREEIFRAKKEEREERAREYREREANTIDMLREIAKSRFG